MSKAKINPTKIAKLANLPLTEGEKSLYDAQLSGILEYVDLLESVDVKNVEPTFNVIPNTNVTRKDKVNKSLTQDEATRNAAVKKNGYIVSKGVFENE